MKTGFDPNDLVTILDKINRVGSYGKYRDNPVVRGFISEVKMEIRTWYLKKGKGKSDVVGLQ